MLNTAFVFPGQGSQSIGMLSDFDSQYPIVRNVFTETSETLGYDLWQLVQSGPEEKLNQTEYTQVAMLTADVAVYKVLMQQGVSKPRIMAGHSLGEYAALVCASALSLSDAVQLVTRRGQIMQNAIPLGLGSMAAIIGLTDEHVKNLCEQASTDIQKVSPANYNAIGQVVVAGHYSAVEKLITLADEEGARLAKMLPVSVPCHCPLLSDASELFAESLAQVEFKNPDIQVISNVDVGTYHSAQDIRMKLKQHLYSPVRWVETIQLFKNSGIERIIESGPGKVLCGLIKRIDKSLSTNCVYDTISLEQVIEQLNTTLD
jgi:[acyl-carrier-protein] S-malonyltransferase